MIPITSSSACIIESIVESDAVLSINKLKPPAAKRILLKLENDVMIERQLKNFINYERSSVTVRLRL
jgi:hypothetical protein